MEPDSCSDQNSELSSESEPENTSKQGDIDQTGIWQVSIWSVVRELRKQQIPEPEIRRRLECLMKEADMSIDLDIFMGDHDE